MLRELQAMEQPKAESPDRCITYSLHMRILQCLLSSSCRCNASRLVQQYKANNSCSVVPGHLLQIQICHLSTESAALRYSTLGRDVFASWHSLFLAPDSWLPHLTSTPCHPGVVAACLPVHRWTDTSEGSSVASSLVSAVCDEPVTLNLICQIPNLLNFHSAINC